MPRTTAGRRRAAALAVAVTTAALCLAAGFAPAAAANAPGVPFTDPAARGLLTLCNQQGQAMTSGSLTAQPFVWRAVSSVPAPAGYTSAVGRTALAAYQPIQYENPLDWSGELLTGSSSYSKAATPLEQSTAADQPLLGFTQAYPARWDGLEEVRMLFTGTNKPVASTYPIAVIRINGTTWSLVEGGHSSCTHSGTGVSNETLLLPKKTLHGQSSPVADSSSTASGAGSNGTGGSGTANGQPGSTSGGSQNSAGASGLSADSTHDNSGGGLGPVAIALIAVAVIGAGALGVRGLRSRRSNP